MATKEELDFKAHVADLGCIVDIEDDCGGKRLCGSPACLHHPRGAAFETGTGRKSEWKDLIPLCPMHHQFGGFGIAYHAGAKTWEAKFGTQEDLLIKRDKLLGIINEE